MLYRGMDRAQLDAAYNNLAAGTIIPKNLCRLAARSATLRLLSATGRMTAGQLGLPADIYDPVRHYRGVRDRWGGTTPSP